MIDPTHPHSRPLPVSARALACFAASLGFALAAVAGACTAPPTKCVAAPASGNEAAPTAPANGPATAPATVPSTAPATAPAATGGLTASPLTPQGPRGVEARDLINALFARDFGAVRSRLTVELGQDLTDAKLGDIVTGLVQAHGPAMRLIDAWTTTIKEKEIIMPAASSTVLMANDVRVGLLLVYDEQGMIKGLWLRPI